MRNPRRSSAALTALAVLAAGLAAATSGAAPVAAADAAVTWTDGFDGTSLDSRWNVVNPEPDKVSVSDGALRIAGQPGDTYQTVNTAKNVIVLDVPAGDFTATADVSAPVSKVFQGAGLIARARWTVSPERRGGYAVRVVTRRSATLARSVDVARVRLR